jgi:hypothetical protein
MSQVKWSNKNAVKHLLLSIKNYGMPSVINQNEGGIAIWNENDLKDKKFFGKSNCFQEMIIRDESVEHLCPAKHYDFMYNSIVVPVKPDQIKILSSLSGSVIYDPLKNFLTARCGSIEAILATLALCTDLLLGNHNITDVHNKGIYGTMINKTSDEDFVKGLYSDLCENIKKLNKESKLNKGFWAAAFSVSGDNCLPPDKANKLYGGAKNQTNLKKEDHLNQINLKKEDHLNQINLKKEDHHINQTNLKKEDHLNQINQRRGDHHINQTNLKKEDHLNQINQRKIKSNYF